MNKFYFLIASLAVCAHLEAKVSLPSYFSDNMVLQQNAEVKFWGNDTPGRTVTIIPSWDGITYQAVTGEEGRWCLKIKTPSYGGPYTISISDGKKKKDQAVLNNVLIGEVWLCGGQSNMELNMSEGIINSDKEFEASENGAFDNIRLFHFDNSCSLTLSDDIKPRFGGWTECKGEGLGNFSATAFYYGKMLNEELGVPIGLIESCWGGTNIESWISEKTLSQIHDFDEQLANARAFPKTKEGLDSLYAANMDSWAEAMRQIDPGFDGFNPVWASLDYDDSQWDNLEQSWIPIEFQGYNIDGVYWTRKTVEIPQSWAGKDICINLDQIDDAGYTFFNGTCIGHAEQGMKSTFTVPGSQVKAGKAVISVRVLDKGGLGGNWCEENAKYIVQDGKDTISLARDWKIKITHTNLSELPQLPHSFNNLNWVPCCLYNAMINPLRGITIKGAIWYQGENNASRARQYRVLMPMLIADWRTVWGQDMPFYFCQLANYGQSSIWGEPSGWAELRDAQALAAKHVANTGMAVLIDIGESGDIHPRDKYDVGKRLALQSLAKTYGKDVICEGPQISDYVIEGNKIRVSFKHTEGGLHTATFDKNAFRAEFKDMPVEGFGIAGADQVFHKADAVIDGDTVVISCPDVPYPQAVRYAWSNCPDCNLYNGAGLPAAPFSCL